MWPDSANQCDVPAVRRHFRTEYTSRRNFLGRTLRLLPRARSGRSQKGFWWWVSGCAAANRPESALSRLWRLRGPILSRFGRFLASFRHTTWGLSEFARVAATRSTRLVKTNRMVVFRGRLDHLSPSTAAKKSLKTPMIHST